MASTPEHLADAPPASLSAAPLTPARLLRVSLVYALTFAAVFWWVWVPGESQRALGWDMLTEYWGDLGYQAKWLARGDAPLWNPFERLGFPAYADPQAGQLYPLNWITYPLAWLGGEMPSWSVVLKNLMHITLAAVGMYAFLWRRKQIAPACWLGGYLFALSTPLISFTASALLWPVSWLPWIWLALDRLFERPGVLRGLALGGLLALPILAGNPPSLFYLVIGSSFLGVQLLVSAWKRGERWAYFKPLLMGLGTAMVVAVLLGSPALLPVQEVYAWSVRTRRNDVFLLRTNLDTYKLLGLLLPNLSTRGYHYGLLTLFLCGVALIKQPRAVLWAALLSLFATLIAIGEHGFLLKPVATLLPPFGLFRGPHRYAVLCSAGLAVWAPMGLTALAQMAPEKRRKVALGLGIFGLLAIGIYAGLGSWLSEARGPKVKGQPAAEIEALYLGAGLAIGLVLVAGLAFIRRFQRPVWAWAAVPITVAALWIGAYDGLPGNAFPMPETPNDGVLAELKYDPLKTRLYDDQFLLYRPGVRLEVRDVSGYEGDPLGSRRYDDIIKRMRRRPEHLRHLAAGFYLRGRHPRLPVRLRTAHRNRHFKRLKRNVWSVPDAAPQVYVVPAMERVKTAHQARDKWLRSKPGQYAVVADEDFDPALQPLIEAPGGEATAGRYTAFEPDGLTAEVDSPGGGLAVFVENWYPAWRATVDGKPAKIHRVNYMLRGVVVPPGKHTIEMRFAPGRWSTSLGLVGLGLLALLAGLWWRRRQGDAPSAQASTPPA